MLNKLVLGACLALSLAACTSSAPKRDLANGSVFKMTETPPGCVPDTATRLPVRPGDCAGFGHVYSRQDIERTGAHTTSDMLRVADPSLVITGR